MAVTLVIQQFYRVSRGKRSSTPKRKEKIHLYKNPDTNVYRGITHSCPKVEIIQMPIN